MAQPLKRCGKIAAVVARKAKAGVPVQEIFASIQSYQNAPGSLTTFYKYYRTDIEAARGEVTEELGNKVIQQAKAGDYKSQELWLTTKGGWNKNNINTNIETNFTEEEKNSALDSLLSKLGFNEERSE